MHYTQDNLEKLGFKFTGQLMNALPYAQYAYPSVTFLSFDSLSSFIASVPTFASNLPETILRTGASMSGGYIGQKMTEKIASGLNKLYSFFKQPQVLESDSALSIIENNNQELQL